jgi:uncharacterized protein (TIGR02001 family)
LKSTIHKKIALAAMTLVAATAFAQEAAPAAPAAAEAAPQNTLAFNVGVASEYRYRGISQSRFDPALQGGVDFTHTSGFYVGAWASTIQWIKDAGTIAKVNAKGPIELDLYGGYRGEVVKDLAFDVGYLRYQYVNNTLSNVTGANANTDELYGALTYGMFTAKYSHAVSNLFGTPNSKNSGYLDLSATVDLGNGLSLVPHLGRQYVKNNGADSYTDYALTLNKDLGNGIVLSGALIGTDAKNGVYVSPSNKNLGRDTLVVMAKYNF